MLEAKKSFKYVYIPADVTEPLQQCELPIPEGKDVEVLLDHLKVHFGGTGMTTSQREQRKQALLQQLGENADKVNLSMLDMAADMQMVENISLLANHRDVGYVGINMYADDQAQAKQLPFNPRATGIAECCGKLIQVRGDVFIARIYDDDDKFERLDFTLDEMSSTAAWVKDAKKQAAKREGQSGDMQQILAQRIQTQAPKSDSTTYKQAIKPVSEAESAKERGNVYVKQGDWQAACDAYTQALELDPQLTAARSNRALAYVKLKLWQEALQDCDLVLAQDPQHIKALLRRAAAHEALQDRVKAAEDYTQVLRIEPVNKEAAAALDRLKPAPAPTEEPGGAQ